MDWTAAMNQYWTSYKRWTLFFPRALRKKVYIVYTFVRVADQIVDTPWISKKTAQRDITTMKNKTRDARQSKNIDDVLINEFVFLAKENNFEREWIEAFFEAMHMDTVIDRYQSYEQLQTYMYGSAEVIGLMMTQLIWYHGVKQEVLWYARKLGEAMQYTNFLRDVREDVVEHDRIYIPSERLSAYWLSHNNLLDFAQNGSSDEKWRLFCSKEIEQCRTIYQDALQWVACLDKQWRFAVYLASMLYAGILRKIEQLGYDQFANDCHTTKREKFRLFLWAVFTYYKR